MNRLFSLTLRNATMAVLAAACGASPEILQKSSALSSAQGLASPRPTPQNKEPTVIASPTPDHSTAEPAAATPTPAAQPAAPAQPAPQPAPHQKPVPTPASKPAPTPKPPVGDVTVQNLSAIAPIFDTDVPAEQVQLIQSDLQLLHTMKPANDAFIKGQFGMTEMTTSAMETWLAARVKYFLSEKRTLSTDAGGDLITLKQRMSYPNIQDPSVNEDLLNWLATSATEESASLVQASNAGAWIYATAKSRADYDAETGEFVGNRLAIQIAGKVVPIDSARVGIIKIGPGHFIGYAGKSLESHANALIRLMTLFHEGRHSDGTGHTLTFSHFTCPKDHDLAGLPACDVAPNGPYSIGAATLLAFMKTCTSCTAKEQQIMNLHYVDSLNRVVDPSTVGWTEARAKVFDKKAHDLSANGDNWNSAMVSRLAKFLREVLANLKAPWNGEPETATIVTP